MTIISGMPVVAGQEERELPTTDPVRDHDQPAARRPWDAPLARASRLWAEDGPFLVVLAATFVFCLFLLRPGHDWGDDFSLYINQARALVKGEVQEVYRQNQFTVDNSAWQSFSPYTYGWGFPLLLAPLYALFGLSFTAFKLLEVVLYLGFLTGFYALIRNRIDRLAAVLIVAALALDNLYTAWTNTVLTEFPFLCFSVLGLLAIESTHRADRLARRPPGVGLLAALLGTGALIGFTTNIRNEGVVLLGALAARQLVVLYEHRRDWARHVDRPPGHARPPVAGRGRRRLRHPGPAPHGRRTRARPVRRAGRPQLRDERRLLPPDHGRAPGDQGQGARHGAPRPHRLPARPRARGDAARRAA